MNLTEYQKKLANLINDGQINDFESFLNYNQDIFDLIQFTTKTIIMKGEGVEDWLGAGLDKAYYVEKPSEALNIMKEFMTLWDKLEKNGLIKTIPREDLTISTKLHPICVSKQVYGRISKYHSNAHNIILNEYRRKQIIPLLELKDFINDNYFTKAESEKISENKNREITLEMTNESLKLSRKSLRLTLILAIITLVITIIIQVIFSSKERDVKIVNPELFKDTVSVKILKNDGL